MELNRILQMKITSKSRTWLIINSIICLSNAWFVVHCTRYCSELKKRGRFVRLAATIMPFTIVFRISYWVKAKNLLNSRVQESWICSWMARIICTLLGQLLATFFHGKKSNCIYSFWTRLIDMYYFLKVVLVLTSW